MAASLSLSVTFGPTLNDGTFLGTNVAETISVPITGLHGTKYNKNIATSDSSFSLDEVSTIGYVKLRNRAQAVAVTTPSAPVITEQGTPGSTTRDYKIVALQSDGTYSAASSAGITTTGAATLNSTDYEQVDWTAVPGATSYDVYRTVAGGTPSTTGKIGSTTSNTFNDTGLAGDASTAPATAADNLALFGHTSGTYTLSLKGGEMSVFRWNQAALHHKANTRIVPIEITILDD